MYQSIHVVASEVTLPTSTTSTVFATEFRKSFSLAWPLVVTYLSQCLMVLVGMAYVGHLGPSELGAASLGNMFCNLTGVVLGFGLATALDTLTAQAYGAGDERSRGMVGVHCQRCEFLLLLCTIPVGILWLRYTEPFLLWTGQSADMAALAGRFTALSLPGIFFTFTSEVVKRFLQCQGKSAEILLSAAVAAASAPVLLWLLIYSSPGAGLGFSGCPIGLSLVNSIMCLWLVGTVALRPDCRGGGVWRGWSSEALDLCGRPEARELLALGLPGLVMLGAEWGAYEGLSILAGLCGPGDSDDSGDDGGGGGGGGGGDSSGGARLPWDYLDGFFESRQVSLAAHAVAASTLTFLFMVPMGLADATAVRVGGKLGSGDAGAARTAAAANAALILICEVVLSSGVVLLRGPITRFYSSDPAVLLLCDKLFPVLASFMLFDGCQAVMAGALRGAGKQDIAAIINVLAFYVAGLPASAYLGLRCRWGVLGIWAGIGLAVLIQVVLYAIVLFRLDWAAAVEDAAERNRSSESDEGIGIDIGIGGDSGGDGGGASLEMTRTSGGQREAAAAGDGGYVGAQSEQDRLVSRQGARGWGWITAPTASVLATRQKRQEGAKGGALRGAESSAARYMRVGGGGAGMTGIADSQKR